MNTDQIVTASSISSKIITFFVFAAIEITCNSINFFTNLKPDNLLQSGAINNPNMGLQ